MEKEKIQLAILGLATSSKPLNSYAVILKEIGGERTLPIIIGAFEAQSIALEVEGHTPARPMTHDLIKALISSTNIVLTEVFLSDFKDGIFFSQLIFEDEKFEIDCRPSDAIAIALRCNAPIYVNEDILEEVGLVSQIDLMKNVNLLNNNKQTKMATLELRLEKAIKSEDYELAAKIRDEIKKFLESQ